jgi:hypothetical protein
VCEEKEKLGILGVLVHLKFEFVISEFSNSSNLPQIHASVIKDCCSENVCVDVPLPSPRQSM